MHGQGENRWRGVNLLYTKQQKQAPCPRPAVSFLFRMEAANGQKGQGQATKEIANPNGTGCCRSAATRYGGLTAGKGEDTRQPVTTCSNRAEPKRRTARNHPAPLVERPKDRESVASGREVENSQHREGPSRGRHTRGRGEEKGRGASHARRDEFQKGSSKERFSRLEKEKNHGQRTKNLAPTNPPGDPQPQ